jgi:thioredoxin-like negative regulator of GroEL
VLEELAQKAGSRVQFYKVDVDKSRELAAARGVKSMPTLQFFRSGAQVHEIIGELASLLF